MPPKVTVYVKHYLTPAGLSFLQKKWFPELYALMKEQKGFLHLSFQITNDCADIKLQFENDATFDSWVLHPRHDAFVNALNSYRSQRYWKVVRTTDEAADPLHLTWTVIETKPQ